MDSKVYIQFYLVSTADEVAVKIERDVARPLLEVKARRVAVDGVEEAAGAGVAVDLPTVLELSENNDEVALHVGAEVGAVCVWHVHVLIQELVPQSAWAGDHEGVEEGETGVAGHQHLLDDDPAGPRDTDHLGLVHQRDLLYEVLVGVEVNVQPDLHIALLFEIFGKICHYQLAISLVQSLDVVI